MSNKNEVKQLPSLFDVGQEVLHVATGRVYRILMTPSDTFTEKEIEPVYVYRRVDDIDSEKNNWVRSKREMEDGRFCLTSRSKTPTSPSVCAPTRDKKHSHYFKDVSGLQEIDVYRVCDLFNVTDAAISHAIKKLLLPGGRGAKGYKKDLQEAIDSIQRKIVMLEEDEARDPSEEGPVEHYP